MEHAIAVVALACAGALIGWFAVPWVADRLLRRAYRRAHGWWWESFSSYREFKRTHPQREPSSRAAGEEGAIGLWRVQAVRSAQMGSLPRERASALAEVGCDVDVVRSLRSEAEQERRCTFPVRLWHRFVGAVSCAASCGFAALQAGFSVPGAAITVAVVAMAVAVACDLRARIVPLETCAVIAGAGALFQMTTAGLQGLVVGGVFAVVIVLACIAVNRLFGRKGGVPVGYGDVRCMAALSLASGAATPVGVVACYVAAAAFSLVGIAARRMTCKSGIPMAPFLALWLMSGMYAGLLSTV